MSSPGRGPEPDADPFEHDDAAYLLGALDSADRVAFEAHLADCAACTARVTALRPVAGLLASGGDAVRDALRLSLEAAGEAATAQFPPAPQPDRVAEVVHLIERRRRRTRWMVSGLATVAAAAIAALVVVLAVPSASPATTVASGQMTATGGAAIRATAAIAAAPWGSEITIDCSYIGASQYTSGDVYALEVVDRSGRSHEIGSWTLARSPQVRFTSGTALPPGEIRAVTVVRPDGTVILRLSV